MVHAEPQAPSRAAGANRVVRPKAPRSQGGAYVLLLPAMVLFTVFTFIPIVWSIILSFENYNIFSNTATYVGFHNYAALLHSATFYQSLAATAYYTFGSVPITVALALFLAVLLNRRGLVGAKVFQMIFFLPYIVSSVGASLVWKWMFDTNFGIINAFLGFFGIHPIAWLTQTSTAMPALIIMTIWGGVGFAVVLFQAGLRAVPSELTEAAAIDGATGNQIFWRITFPLLAPTTLFVLVISIINAAQVFTTVQVMTAGGPLNATNVIVYYIYQEAFQFFNMGYGAAVAIVLFIIILALTAVMMLGSRRFVYYEGETRDDH
ncbi:MAG: sugar ABC transporter permease [Firmicutes bacterium]|nr:sugar ABC transporter permease [Bacillota bacterium]